MAALSFYKEHFGPENFFNIFKCFYQLAHVPENAQNNPAELYIDRSSMVKGFKITFGIDFEEVAVRVFNLFNHIYEVVHQKKKEEEMKQ